MDSNPAIIYAKPGLVVIEERDLPRLDAGDLLIESECTMISTGTELTLLSGDYDGSAWDACVSFPMQAGYCHVGRVVDVGPGLGDEWLGRRVASHCCHQRFVKAAADTVRLVPERIPADQAPFFILAEIAMNGIRRSGLVWGETAAVYGLGIIGQLVAQLCQVAGALPVIGIDVSRARLERLNNNVVGLHPDEEDIVEAVRDCTRGRMVDVVFEVTGNGKLIPQEMEILRNQGRLVLLSSPRTPTSFNFHDLCNAPSHTIIGAHNSSHPPHPTPGNPWTAKRHAELFFDLIADGLLDVESLISHVITCYEAPEIYSQLLEDRSPFMGIIIDWRNMRAD